MIFLYGELLVLMFVSFAVGCALAGVALRLVVRRTVGEPQEEPAPPAAPAQEAPR